MQRAGRLMRARSTCNKAKLCKKCLSIQVQSGMQMEQEDGVVRIHSLDTPKDWGTTTEASRVMIAARPPYRRHSPAFKSQSNCTFHR